MMKKDEFWVIGIGASAGGLEALTAFVKNLPVKSNNAVFIIAQHLAPHAKSMMVELLGRQTRLPVLALPDRRTLKTGTIYVIPPNYDLTFEKKIPKLTRAGEETRPKPSVDTFFRSLAENWGNRAVGIILSGTGTDGAEGVRAIKERGGIVLLQDPLSAKYDGMPRATLETGMVDATLLPEQIGQRLGELLAEHTQSGQAEEAGMDGNVDLREILNHLKKLSGSDFTEYKVSTIARRVEKRMTAVNLPDIHAYHQFLLDNADEAKVLAQEMLISVTTFFRDAAAFEKLSQQIDLIVQSKKEDEELRVWVAGCATGEEAYTIAILAFEAFQRQGRVPSIKIFATDLDQPAISYARQGLYVPNELQGMSEDRLNLYFERKERSYEVKRFIRDMIVFARQNIIQNPPFVKLDLVTCRNVLIYFDSTLQNRVFDIFQYALRPGGTLFLGQSENAPDDLFETLDRKSKLYRRLNVLSRAVPPMPRAHAHQTEMARTNARPIPNEFLSSIPTQILNEYKISGVVVDSNGVVFHTVGDISDYLSLPVGAADFRLTNLIAKDASTELSILLRKTGKERRPYVSRFYFSTNEGKTQKNYRFVVRLVDKRPEHSKDLFLVTFEPRRQRKKNPVVSKNPETVAARIGELERELAASKEHLQTLVEELEISNEELQSLNEELSSTNEELQASNEELETTNEEMQSANEELVTVNEELNTKSVELRVSNISLENIQNSIGSPLLVVDSQLRVQSYNRDANRIFTLTGADLQRPITQVSCQSEIEEFEQKLWQTVRTGHISEGGCEVHGHLYQMRILPNRDEEDRIRGAVVVFFDNTVIISTQQKLQESDSNIRAIIDGSPALISLKDGMGKYMVVNRAFLDRHSLSQEKVIGKTDRDLFPAEVANQIRDRDLEVLLRQSSAEGEETIPTKAGERIYFTSRFPLLRNSPVSPQVIGTVSLDITSQVQVQKDLRSSEARYRSIVEDQAVFVCRHLPTGEITFANTAFSNFFGISPQVATKKTFESLVNKIDRERVTVDLAKLSPEHTLIQYEARVENESSAGPAARTSWIRWIHRAIFDEKGTPVEFQAVGFDVTVLRNQTDYLLQKENLFTSVLEHTSDFLTVYRVEGEDFILESFNQSAAKDRNYGHSRLIGKRLAELTDPNEFEKLQKRYSATVKNGKVSTFEEEVGSPGGSRFLLTTLVPIRDENSSVLQIAALSRDITNLKRIEQALREQKRRSDSANQAKSDFLAAMSHEFRTPLSVITGMSQLLGRGTLTPPAQKYVTSIQQASKTLLALIEDVLDLSKIESGKLTIVRQPFGLTDLIDEVMQTFDTQATQRGLNLTAKIAPTLENLKVEGDPIRFKQVLINLIGNALKFTEKGGVTLNTELRESEPGFCKIYFEVKDTGIGIPHDSFERIFTRFSQADSGISRKYGGTGLGLAICKELVELMGGEIGFNSTPGKGSTFWFVIEYPCHEEDGTVAKKEEEVDVKDASILVVDDNVENLKMMSAFLSEHVGTVHTAMNANEGLDLLREESIDVVLMDIQMPGIDGLEATRIIRSWPTDKKDVPIIALTANAMTGDREKFLSEGMNDYVSKPVDFPELLKRISKWKAQTPAHD